MTVALTFAFIAGVVSSVNPCGFALLPAYFAHKLGSQSDEFLNPTRNVSLAIIAGAVTTLGFILIFGIIGGIISFGAVWLTNALPWTGLAIGILLALIGVVVTIGGHIGVSIPALNFGAGWSGLRGDFAFGVGYGTASLSCTLPVFLSVTGIAATGGVALSFVSFVAYGLGMGTILMAIAVTAALSRDGLARTIKGVLPYAHRIGGAVLTLAGLYVIYYWGSLLLTSDITASNAIVDIGEKLSGALSRSLGSDAGQILAYGLLIAIVAFVAWAFWQRSITNLSNRDFSASADAGPDRS